MFFDYMMDYEGNIFRPPAEHRSILLQVTVGCSHNKCKFCGLYKDKKFKIKEEHVINRDIDTASKYLRNQKRLFLCDGDALIIPTEKLLCILKQINNKLPWINRIGLYGNAKSIMKKSKDELIELKKHKLGIVYMGIESGDDEILKIMDKGVDVATQIEQAKKVKEAGLKLSCTVILGLGGIKKSENHAVLTGKALSVIDPNYVGALSLILYPNMPLMKMISSKEFTPIKPYDTLKELVIMMENTDLSSGIFSANHASNYLPVQARFPSEKEETINSIKAVINTGKQLKPEWARGI